VPKVLLDTATYFDIQRARKHMREVWAINTLRHLATYSLQHGKPSLSCLSVMEVSAGFKDELRSLQMKAFTENVLPMFHIVDFGVSAACLAGEIYQKLEGKRLRIGVADTAIASVALRQDLAVVTSNFKHYQRIVDLGYPLLIQNWREA
jgi:tRNA(fMet)-specific endonuclease VapC